MAKKDATMKVGEVDKTNVTVKTVQRPDSPAAVIRRRRSLGEIPDPLRVRVSCDSLGIVVRWVLKSKLPFRKAFGWDVVKGELAKKVREAGLDVMLDGTDTSVDSTLQMSGLILVYMPKDLHEELCQEMNELANGKIKKSVASYNADIKKLSKKYGSGLSAFDDTRSKQKPAVRRTAPEPEED